MNPNNEPENPNHKLRRAFAVLGAVATLGAGAATYDYFKDGTPAQRAHDTEQTELGKTVEQRVIQNQLDTQASQATMPNQDNSVNIGTPPTRENQ